MKTLHKAKTHPAEIQELSCVYLPHKVERVARYVGLVSGLYERALDINEIDKRVAERHRLNTMPPPADIEANVKELLLRLAHRQEEVMYEKEFPGHPLPPFPDY